MANAFKPGDRAMRRGWERFDSRLKCEFCSAHGDTEGGKLFVTTGDSVATGSLSSFFVVGALPFRPETADTPVRGKITGFASYKGTLALPVLGSQSLAKLEVLLFDRGPLGEAADLSVLMGSKTLFEDRCEESKLNDPCIRKFANTVTLDMPVTIQTARLYELQFRLTCLVDSSVPGGVCHFHDNIPVLPNGFAELKEVAFVIEPDVASLIGIDFLSGESLKGLITEVNSQIDDLSLQLAGIGELKSQLDSISFDLDALAGGVEQGLGAVGLQMTDLDADLVRHDGALARLQDRMLSISEDVLARVNSIQGVLAQVQRAQQDQLARDLRLAVEENLSSEKSPPIILFHLPSNRGGQLEVARALVAERIAQTVAAGGKIGLAGRFLLSGDARKAQGDYKGAYEAYRRSYGELSSQK